METKFSTKWNASALPRKQRKYRFNAPLHVQQKFVHAPLSKTLREQYKTRRVQLSKGDTVVVTRGEFAKKEGKVSRVLLKQGKVYVEGVERIKKEGSKLLAPLCPSNVQIVALNLKDKRRKEKLEAKRGTTQ